jgi:UDPglucose 6-dehydrogenase
MLDACIIGMGMVGQATDHAFNIGKHFDLKGSNITLEEAATKRYIFICLPTPVVDGKYQTDDIIKIIKQIRDYSLGQNVFIIRSTVYPGFCRHVMDILGISWVVHVPEFLTEATWREDAENPDIIVIGADDLVFREDVEGVFRARYQRSVEIFTTDTVTSELTKMAINGFYTTKVTYANEIYEVARKVDANYETLKNIMYKRKWIGNNHLDVWHNGKRGVSGKCLPKDLEALVCISDSKLLKVVKELNERNLGRKE